MKRTYSQMHGNAILISFFFFFFLPRGKWKLIILIHAEFSDLKNQPARKF